MISVIVSFYERIDHLRCCLDSLELSKGVFDEVVITDDGSQEETVSRVRALIKNYDFTIKYCWQPKKGFRVAAARNNGIRHSIGDYLIFYDCDFLILPGTVQQHINFSRASTFVAGHCKYLTEQQTKEVFDSSVSKKLLEKLYDSTSGEELAKDHRRFVKRTLLMKLRLVSPRKQCLGGHFSIYRKDIEKINGYDEKYIGWGGEDEDVGIRLVRAGIYCRSAIKCARVLHMWHQPALKNRAWEQGQNIEYFKQKDKPIFCENGLIKSV